MKPLTTLEIESLQEYDATNPIKFCCRCRQEKPIVKFTPSRKGNVPGIIRRSDLCDDCKEAETKADPVIRAVLSKKWTGNFLEGVIENNEADTRAS